MTDSIYDMSDVTPKIDTAESTLPTAPQKEYTRVHGYFAIAFLFAGFAFVKLAMYSGSALGSAIFGIAVIIASTAFAMAASAKKSRFSAVYLSISAAFTVNLALSDNDVIRILSFAFAALMYAIWAFSLNNPDFGGADNNLVYTILSAFFGQSFGSLDGCVRSVSALTKGSKAGKNVKNVIIGLVIAVPITLIVALLLMSADDNFGRILTGFFDDFLGSCISNALTFVFSLPISFLLFGIMYSAAANKKTSRLDYAACAEKNARRRIAPMTVICSSVIPVCLLYVMFFFSQLSYFVSAFAGKLPDSFSAAEYARKGFFELCAVSVINLGIIALINLFCRRSESGACPKALRFFTVLLSAFTLVLIATALSKMVMYITRFGMTRLRYFTSWFMAVLAVLFVLIILRQCVSFNMARFGSVCFTVMFALLCFIPADSVITKYNIYAYESGLTAEFDANYLENELSCDAYYAVKPLLNSNDAVLREAAEKFVRNSEQDADWRSLSLTVLLTSTL